MNAFGFLTAERPVRWHKAVSSFDGAGERLASRLRGKLWADALFYSATAAAEHGIGWHLVALLTALRGRPRRAAILSAGLLAESLVVDVALKSAFGRGRPEVDLNHRFALRRPRSASFPSGHASAAAFASTYLATPNNAPVVASAAAVVAWSRVHVGVHHPSDVAGGLVVGTVLGAFARLVHKKWPEPERHRG